MTDLSLMFLICIGVSAFLIGFSKTSVGGLVIVVVPLAAIAVPGPESTGLILPMMIAADFLAVVSYYQSCEWKIICRIFPITAIGVAIGYLIMGWLPREIFSPVLGILIIIMMVIGWIVEEKPVPPIGSRIITWFVGICAGISTMIANAAGPLMGIYLLQQGLPKANFIGTRSMFFLLLNLYKLPFSSHLGLVTPSSLKLNILFLPLIILGAYTGVKVLKYIKLSVFKQIVRIAALLSAAKLLFG